MRPHAFAVGLYGFFWTRSRKCIWPSHGTFINGFAKKAFAGPYGSNDKLQYLSSTIAALRIQAFTKLINGQLMMSTSGSSHGGNE